MKSHLALVVAVIFAVGGSTRDGQAAQASSTPVAAGKPLGVTVDGRYTPMSANVKVYGGIVSAESCSYDPTRNLIMVVNRGANQNEVPNDGFVSLLNHDGSVHTARWIGGSRDGLTLNHPFGSALFGGKLYLADSDGGTSDGAPRVGVIRMFDIASGTPAGEVRVPDSQWINDIAVAADGTVYASQTGSPDGKTAMRIYKITPSGNVDLFLEGAPLSLPNGVELDRDGNVVIVNIGNADVMTFSPEGKLLKTEQAAQSGNDGIVIMKDGTKYVSSVRLGGISRIRPGRAAELIATGIPSAASMCFDPLAKQLVIPMNPNNGVAIVKLK